ncbi:MAG: ABC transporter ATP-binding protein [Sulfuricella sp.]|nr:ABC transporter ATP-binding protein [Sulfuricella sp.]
MSDEIAIAITGLSKCYHLYESPIERLKQALWGGGQLKEFWALKEVSFAVKKGESVGIIGRNGSGKSTLLQILAGTLKPTSGEIVVNGRVAALLELGSGFNPEYTGRENVYLNGALLGLTRPQIEACFDDIVSFADIGEFLDQPVKTYSSGMTVRLAFAVQTAVEPEVLIVDEALSVGDFFFQQKCARRMQHLRDRGTTLLFVSHDMGVVRDLCERAVYLRHGEMLFSGDSSDAIWQYFQEDRKPEPVREAQPVCHCVASDILEQFQQIALWTDLSMPADSSAKILGVALLDSNREPTAKVIMGDELIIQVLFLAYQDGTYDAAVEIKNRHDQIVTSNGSETYGIEPLSLKSGALGLFELKLTCALEAGQYTFQASIGAGGHSPNRGYPVNVTPWLGPFSLTWNYETDPAPFLGMFGVPLTARFIRPN